MTNQEIETIKQLVLEAIRSESTDITELEEATSLDGINSLPAMQGSKLVIVPISLLGEDLVHKDDNGLVSLDNLPKEVDNVILFGGFGNFSNIEQAGAPKKSTDEVCAVMYSETTNKFAMYYNGQYYASWVDSNRFGEPSGSGYAPIPNKIYVDKTKNNIYVAEEGILKKVMPQHVLDIGTFDSKDAACAYAGRAEIAGNKQVALIIFKAKDMTGAMLEGRIFQQLNGQEVSMQILMWDKKLYRRNVTGATGVEGDNTSPYAWSEFGAHNLTYDATSHKLSMSSYENGVIAEVELPTASTNAAGLMTGDDKTRLNNTLVASVGAFDFDISDTTKDNPVTVEMSSTQTTGGDIVFAWGKLGTGSLQLTSAGFYYRVNGKYYTLSAEPAKPIPNKNGILTNRAKTEVYICVNDELVKIIGE